MKSFFKAVLANIVAILLVSGLLFFFLIFIIVVAGFSDGSKVKVKDNSVLTLTMKTDVIDSPTEDQHAFFLPDKNSAQKVLVYNIIDAIKRAKTDDKIKGISIETDNINAGITQLDDIRSALLDFKKTGKFVYAYGNVVSQPAYFLGSVADQYVLNPMGGVELKGMSTEVVFFKNFAEKYGIGLDVIRHGKFKAAVEPFLRNDISSENKEQLSVLLNDIWQNTSKKIYTSRKIDSAQFKLVVDSLYGLIPESAIKYRLADKLLQKSEYDNIIKNKIGLDKDKDLIKISFNKYAESFKNDIEKEEKIAVLYASGSINNGEGYQDIHSVDFVKYIKDLQEDKDVKAVVLRINSPGGSANASDEILFELQQLKKKKPLVVSFGDYAASGGYYVAMAADKIYSEPNTLTGSIGVFGMIYNVGPIANKNGIRSDIVQTNDNTRYYSALHGLSNGGKAIITKSIEGTYKRFVHWVTQNRKKSFEEIDAIGGGRVWSGKRAKQLGLVDELGTLNDAIAFAAKKANLKEYSVKAYPKKKSQFEQFFESMEGENISTMLIKSKLGKENFKIYEELVKANPQNAVMMEMPYRISIK